VRPLADGDFGPDAVNVAAQRRDETSMLSWMQRLLRVRRSTPEIGCGAYDVLVVDDPAVLACVATTGDERVLVVHHLADRPTRCSFRVDGAALAEGLLPHGDVHADDGRFEMELDRFEHRWFRLRAS
jgi:glycosidase